MIYLNEIFFHTSSIFNVPLQENQFSINRCFKTYETLNVDDHSLANLNK